MCYSSLDMIYRCMWNDLNEVLCVPEWHLCLQIGCNATPASHTLDIIIKLHQIVQTKPQHIWVFLFSFFFQLLLFHICVPVRLIDGRYIYTWKRFSGEAARLLTASWILPSWSHSSERSRWVIRSQQTSQQRRQIADTPAVLTQDNIKLRGIELGSLFGIIEKLLLFFLLICLSGTKKSVCFFYKKEGL